jgi:hypothetical protein
MVYKRWALNVPVLVIAGACGFWLWVTSGGDGTDRSRGLALENCIKNYNAGTGRRDAAIALHRGDARLLYVINHYQEGSEAYIPGVETIGVSGEGWFPSNDLTELVGHFDGDSQVYWLSVKPAKLAAGPKPWYLPIDQDDPRRVKCHKAETAYLEAYNSSIPPERVPRRPAPKPDPRFATGAGRPPVDPSSDIQQ